ncbi:uncharacterized protein LOC131009260 [Salvia miltiorrhiza]|uniref:uncharacterized protein LOC131009260 n=1 Tax=Salvia miltiorrhiza TaxID=226208 RepID=UPI0025AD3B32|nr:uncharacterized protein LOC131009260 [Salvia miltiorrhiza]XP_057792525.1 uncharacterized protein LOC131009260 [Salvia miltiorrhiza]
MSTTLSTLFSKTPIKLSPPKNPSRFHLSNSSFPITSSPPTKKAKPLNKLQISHSFYGSFKKSFNGFPVDKNGFLVKAQNESGSVDNSRNEETQIRGESSMPERFRYLTKEAPDKPVRWPFLIVLAFLLYAWRTVLWELSNWRKALGALTWFLGYISKLLLALVFLFIGDPLTSAIRLVETAFVSVRSFYSGVVAYAPIPELTLIIMLTSAVLAVAETASPDSVNSQPYLLTLAGLVGFAAVRNYITELFFWTLLVGMFCFARFVKRRDYVSSALPLAAVLAAVGEPWVRVVVMGSYLALAILHHARNSGEAKDDAGTRAIERVPIPLLLAAMAIGVRLAAKWAGYRHLTWMIV